MNRSLNMFTGVLLLGITVGVVFFVGSELALLVPSGSMSLQDSLPRRFFGSMSLQESLAIMMRPEPQTWGVPIGAGLILCGVVFTRRSVGVGGLVVVAGAWVIVAVLNPELISLLG